MAKHKSNQPILLDGPLVDMMVGIGKLATQYWPGVGMGLSRNGKVWYANTSGLQPEALGSTLEEVEAYMKANPKTEAGEKKKFKDALVSDLMGDMGFGPK